MEHCNTINKNEEKKCINIESCPRCFIKSEKEITHTDRVWENPHMRFYLCKELSWVWKLEGKTQTISFRYSGEKN